MGSKVKLIVHVREGGPGNKAIYGTHEWRRPSLVSLLLVRQVFRGNEVADELISSDVTEPQHYGSPCVYIKSGCVPDKLCVFSADES